MTTQNKIKPAPSFPNRCAKKKGGQIYTYPQDGKLIGPAWELAWELLSRAASPVPLVELGKVVAAMRGDIAEGTTVSLLHHAVDAGVVYATRATPTGRVKHLISVQPIDVEAVNDSLAHSWRPVRELLKREGVMVRQDIIDHLVVEGDLSEHQVVFMLMNLENRKMIISEDEGQTYRWVS